MFIGLNRLKSAIRVIRFDAENEDFLERISSIIESMVSFFYEFIQTTSLKFLETVAQIFNLRYTHINLNYPIEQWSEDIYCYMISQK